MSRFIKKALSRAAAAAPGGPPLDPAFAGAYPALWEFLTVTKLEGKPRQTATLSMWYADGLWKGVLNDRDTDQCLWFQAPTWEGLLVELEALLTGDSVPWRHRQPDGSVTRKRRG